MEFKVNFSLKPHSLSQVVWCKKNKFIIMKNRYKRNDNFIRIHSTLKITKNLERKKSRIQLNHFLNIFS